MDDARGFMVFIFVFLLIVLAAIGLANQNEIMPAVAKAEASASIGAETFLAVEKGAALVMKLLVGAIVAGVAAAVFAEARKAYALWKRSARSGRWQAGPNANWQKTPKAPSEPRLTRQDLMLLALAGRGQSAETMGRIGLGKKRVEQSDDDELNVIF